MRHALAIARREIESYFVSPIAYAVMTIFTFVSGKFFSDIMTVYVRQSVVADQQIQRLGRSEYQLDVPTVVLQNFFGNEGFLLMLALPMLTMGLITDERRKGTLELLMTSPIRSGEIAFGKFLGAFGFVVLMFLPLLPMFAFLAQGGEWEPGVVAAGLCGLLMLAAAQISLGLFVSALCENVLVSAIVTYGLFLTMQFIDTSSGAPDSLWAKVISYFSFYVRQMNSTRGVIEVTDLVYFVSYITLGLFLAQRSIDAIRYRRS